MTKTELIEYYVNLLIMQYKGKPKAEATVRLMVDLCLMDMLIFSVADAFDLYESTGYQLDVIGKYQGVSRTCYTFTRQITLNDDQFRILIQLAIIKNSSVASLQDIDELINKYFGNEMKVYDFGKMRIGYYLTSGIATQDLAEVMIVQGLLPKPAAVSLSSTILYPDLDGFFGYATYSAGVNPKNSPYNTYAIYTTPRPWVSYQMIIGNTQNIISFMMTESFDFINQEDNGHLLT
jgi:hypothetical protein